MAAIQCTQEASLETIRAHGCSRVDGWEDLLLPEIERQRAHRKEVAFRGHVAFARPEVYEANEALKNRLELAFAKGRAPVRVRIKLSKWKFQL